MPAIPIRQGPLILVVFAFQILICIQKGLKLQQAISGRILASTLELSQVVENQMNFQYIILHACKFVRFSHIEGLSPAGAQEASNSLSVYTIYCLHKKKALKIINSSKQTELGISFEIRTFLCIELMSPRNWRVIMSLQLLEARSSLLRNPLQQLLRVFCLLVEHLDPPIHVLIQRSKPWKYSRLFQLRHQLQQRICSLNLLASTIPHTKQGQRSSKREYLI